MLLDDEPEPIPYAQVFDPNEHHFNPLQNIDKRRARELAALLYSPFPQGENTLTVRNGRRRLAEELATAKRLDEVRGPEEVRELMADIFFTPIMRKVLCSNKEQFSFNPNSVIFARVNRAELGEQDAFVLGVLLMHQFAGQIVVPDLGFYGRDLHRNLIRQDRLIAGLDYLDEVPPKLKAALLSIEDKELQGASTVDAELIAKLNGLRNDPHREDNPYNRFIDAATSGLEPVSGRRGEVW
ncbi:hypothetical protein JJE66_33715 [Bradyrhizobium diazoefficiens]|uniref:hypothetical protein n=1 Tax=Bradyrhizobium diazoefficiens TaxID=1355477 RepID=UPI0019093DF2|nr:hypothetical protein [Bradyrhizobium diazoefficiens]MBK3666166.1 hypothetical protein [Bradyrhizobium diazoefficiens]